MTRTTLLASPSAIIALSASRKMLSSTARSNLAAITRPSPKDFFATRLTSSVYVLCLFTTMRANAIGKVIAVRLPDADDAQIQNICRETGLNRSQVLRMLVARALAEGFGKRLVRGLQFRGSSAAV